MALKPFSSLSIFSLHHQAFRFLYFMKWLWCCQGQGHLHTGWQQPKYNKRKKLKIPPYAKIDRAIFIGTLHSNSGMMSIICLLVVAIMQT